MSWESWWKRVTTERARCEGITPAQAGRRMVAESLAVENERQRRMKQPGVGMGRVGPREPFPYVEGSACAVRLREQKATDDG